MRKEKNHGSDHELFPATGSSIIQAASRRAHSTVRDACAGAQMMLNRRAVLKGLGALGASMLVNCTARRTRMIDDKIARERLHEVMARHVERVLLLGLVVLVAQRGSVQSFAIGKQSVDDTTPMRRDTIFRISSMTKPITAAAAMILVEEGKLRLDDPVDPFLPELAGRRVLSRIDGPLEETVPAKRPITLRDLLAFRMGFGLVWGPQDALPIQRAAHALQLGAFGPPRNDAPAPDEWMRRFATLPLMHQPGERWSYHTA